MKRWLIPTILFVFSLISLTTLKSIAPNLVIPQLVFWIMTGVVIGVAWQFKAEFWWKWHWWWYLGLVLLLILTLVIGNLTRGTARWIRVGDLFAIQGSQLAVPLVALTASRFAQKNKLSSWKNIFKFLAILMVPGVLILVAPDLGTTLVYLLSVGMILFVSPIKWHQLLLLLGVALIGLVLSWNLLLKDYQKQRISSFVTPDSDNNYNARQALIAVGSGQFLGKGLGFGSQSHLKFLPERQTDFIFASFAEEWGWVGSILLLSLYTLLIFYIFYYALLQTDNSENYYFLIANVSFLLLQTFINIGMNTGLMPITGVTLPFISYGGSSLLSLGLMIGISQSIIASTESRKGWFLK